MTRLHTLALLAAGCLLAAPHRATAQAAAPLPPLPVSGSMIYNAIVYDQTPGAIGRGSALRFAGRVSVRVASRTYLGVGVGSWVREGAFPCEPGFGCAGLREAYSEAVVHQLYLQQYLVRRTVFVRAGAGLASTETLRPRFDQIESETHIRPAVVLGVGLDLRIAPLLYLTPSFDFGLLPGADGERRELRSGRMFGLGLTLR